MTEAEWLASDDPAAMLGWLRGAAGVSARKLRLFCVACVRHCRSRLTVPWSPDCLGAAERYADGLAGLEEMARVRRARPSSITGGGDPDEAAGWCCHPDLPNAVDFVLAQTSRPGDCPPRLQAAILREVAGNAFPPASLPVRCGRCGGRGWVRDRVPYGDRSVCDACRGEKVAPAPCPWLTPDVASLAAAAYEDRLPSGELDPVTLLALADALEEAGCEGSECEACEVEVKAGRGRARVRMAGVTMTARGMSQKSYLPGCVHCGGSGRRPSPLLAHLRSPGPHWRGCCAVDCVLGKS